MIGAGMNDGPLTSGGPHPGPLPQAGEGERDSVGVVTGGGVY